VPVHLKFDPLYKQSAHWVLSSVIRSLTEHRTEYKLKLIDNVLTHSCTTLS